MRTLFLAGAALGLSAVPAAADYFVVQDATTKRCTIVQEKPTGSQAIIVTGTDTYKTRGAAQSALEQAAGCKADTTVRDKTAPSKNTVVQQSQVTGQVQLLTQAPSGSWSITRLYKQSVYNSNNERIGEVDDVLVTNDGRATALVIGVGGFLGIGETHVIVPFNGVMVSDKGGSVRLTLNSNREELRGATQYRFDRNKHIWSSMERRDERKKSAPEKAPAEKR